ncbi:rho-type GTPase-activating protein-like protein 2 [Phyllosticta citriasiana]|uniref:Rho-type GTPase-activating protein-like protein 2 n=1 Tax=Phyllosticta citriasiana TaxID=595635 RepID=A0ABR1KYF8_9PEZI
MDSPSGYPESPLDDVDVIYHCKGCGEVLEEGKAFELAGNRWHIDCFRCNTCGTLLDSDANLLLLGDGSLICNNCTYCCSACGNKIEDLAILTGDQAFCASCFRCRNCKRKIENLRYARTSQGIFCMSCHESLMARRRKKSKANRQQAESKAPVVLDKSLPALPPQALPQTTYQPDADSLPEVETPEEPSPKLRQAKPVRDHAPSLRIEASPASLERQNEPQTLPASTYREKRRSEMPNLDSDDGIFANVPFALDPNPVPGPSPLADSRSQNRSEDEKNPRDYFNGGKSGSSTSSHRDALKEHLASSRSSSLERRNKSTSSPHIAFQERSRGPSDGIRRKEVGTATATPGERSRAQTSGATPNAPALGEGFKLQEVPKDRKVSRTRSKSDLRSPDDAAPREAPSRGAQSESSAITSPVSASSSYTPTSQDYERGDEPGPMAAPYGASQQVVERPKRGDSLNHHSARKESSPSTPTAPKPSHERKASANSALANRDINTLATMNGGLTISKPVESPTSRSIMDAPPPRSASRPQYYGTKEAIGDSFTAPRAPPQPPQGGHKLHQESISRTLSDGSQPVSPNLLRYSAGGDFSVDDEMARIFRDSDGDTNSVLRRVSNAVKHGRSFSDRGGGVARAPSTQKWKSPVNGAMEISSPIATSPDVKEESAFLRAQLRAAQQRISELETEASGLRESASKSSDMRQVNSELKEKRSTIAVLDTQREVVMRELDLMTEHLKAAKEQNKPLDLQSFQSAFFRDFAAELETFKAKAIAEIEELVQKRNEVNEDIFNLIKMKDKGYQEFESLSQKNSQLMDLNNSLFHGITENLKRGPNGLDGGIPTATNGLGIYNTNVEKDSKAEVSITDLQRAVQEHHMQHLVNDPEEPTVLAAPKVVDIRKTKANKFNWKKGGQAVAKNVTKGLKGAFASQQPYERHDGLTVGGVPYGSMAAGMQPSSDPSIASKVSLDPKKAGFGFFGGGSQGSQQKPAQMPKPAHGHNNSVTNVAAAETLFGADLVERCEFEKATVPSIVRRCIQEVELRGVDVEGIYRKSGGSGQVNQVRTGFEKDAEYDISDPDLDIHAVTSALKQYFRRLPNPLITFDVYDDILFAGQLQDIEKQIFAMRRAIDNLPNHHRNCLEFLIFHLARVMEHKKENLMTAVNLAVVFAPTVMRPMSIEREMTDMGPQRTAIQALLENNKAVFAPEEELVAAAMANQI